MKLPELLAPIGSMEHLKIAINAGASSIYLSGKDYGARKFAENFTLSEIQEAIDYAHLYNVKVYVTVNTLIKESEIEEVLNYLSKLYSLGVDAVLIQDLGLIELINKYLPNLAIHASTQMNIENQLKLSYLEKKGIKRVVLPREMRLKEIKKLKTNMELEIFAHGALCYSYSGQCLMSSLKGGRSGNRGECAQPCRQKYNLNTTNQSKYYLSPKDLSLFNYLNEIIQLGIDCIKIEGRMRNKEYLAIVISQYRKALNKLKNKKQLESEQINLVFNRGHTPGQFKGQSSRSIQPGHLGLNIGKVINVQKSQISIKLNDSLKTIPEKGDGILITDGKDKYGFDISAEPLITTENHYNKKKIKPLKDVNRKNRVLIVKQVKQNKRNKFNLENKQVYLTKRNKLAKKAREIETQATSYIKSPLTLTFSTKNNYPTLKGTLKFKGKSINKTITGKEPFQKPLKHPVDAETVQKQLSKLDNYPFKLEHLNINYNGNKFIPISELNKLRRTLLEALKEEIIQHYKKPLKTIKLESTNRENLSKKISLSYYTNDLNHLKEIENVKRVYLEIPPQENLIYDNSKYDVSVNNMVTFLEEAVKIAYKKDYDLIWKWPDITHDKLVKKLTQTRGILNKKGINLPIMSADFNGQYGSYSLNITNSEAVKSLENYKLLTLSVELEKTDYENLIKNIPDNSKVELIVQGSLELMKTRNKLLSKSEAKKIKTKKDTFLVDRHGNKYPIKENLSNEELIIFNSEELCLIEKLEELISNNYVNFAIDGRWKDINYLKMINIYNSAINGQVNLKQLRRISPKNTKGNY